MKIAIELQPCCSKRSGIGNYTYEIAKCLKNNDKLEFCGNIFNFLGRNDNTEVLKDISIPININKCLPYGIYRRIWNFIPFYYESLFEKETDLNIFFNYIVPPKVKGKVITTIYDMTYERYPETMDRRNFKRLKKGLYESAERSSRIITISDFSKREIIDVMGIPEDKITVIPCAPQPAAPSMEFSKLSQKVNIQKPYLLFTGNIEPRKNLEKLIGAFDLLKQNNNIKHKLVLAGGNGWGNGEIYKKAEHSKFREDIVFTGYVSDSEKSTLYKNADLFVFPSLYEGFGIPPLEAMAQNCPVVCSNAASLPEVVGDAACLVNPSNETDIASGILKVISNSDYKLELIEKGKIRLKVFSWEKSAEIFVDMCKRELDTI